ncbi:MAG: alpha/beta hydrolase [Burkholderiaceae bacterium]|nr:alpha/beta hydrolase [Burkholderiaceae bacterium]
MTYFLDLRAQPVGGSVSSYVKVWADDMLLDASGIPDLVQGQDVLLATHGFNVDDADGRRALGAWESLLTLSGTVYLAVLWPGDSSWALGLDYPFEGNVAIESAKLLASFLDTQMSGASSISFASHSLGARLLLQTAKLSKRKFRRAVIMAGAIDDNCLTGEYAGAAANFESISILASKSDEVLELAFPLGNFLGGILTKDSPYWHGALGRYGPNGTPPAGVSIHAHWEIPAPWEFGHHNYLPGDPVPPKRATPVDVPAPDTPKPPDFPLGTSSWSAAFASTRLEP